MRRSVNGTWGHAADYQLGNPWGPLLMGRKFQMKDLPPLKKELEDLGAIGGAFLAPWPYVILLVFVFIGGGLLTGALWDYYEAFTVRIGEGPTFFVMNFGWAGAVSILAYCTVLILFRRFFSAFRGIGGHFQRSAMMYAVVLICVWTMWSDRGSPDYGLYVQIFYLLISSALPAIALDAAAAVWFNCSQACERRLRMQKTVSPPVP